MDTKKAFDSIDHSYINILLEVVGFAEWTRDFVSALYRFAAVTPVLAAHTGVLIPINRGVKQGCPLSPLLFALAYDPLLVYLSLLKTAYLVKTTITSMVIFFQAKLGPTRFLPGPAGPMLGEAGPS